jgi:hypothetical protein
MKPLLGLVMLVKNEAQGIEETLASVIPFVDCMTILDTGSTDGTQHLIQACTKGSCRIVEEPFVDFSTSRNRALDLHGDATVFTIMLSGDDILLGGTALRAFLEDQRDTATEIFNVERQHGSDRFPTAIVQRTGTGWHYVGRTHEVLTKPGQFATVNIPSALVVRLNDGSPDQKRARWALDLEILGEDVSRNPADPRASFYRAQTLECLGHLREALDEYDRRANLAGWYEETYQAVFRSARVMQALSPLYSWDRIQSRYLQAYAIDPRRAEPLYAIAKKWFDEENHALAYLFASRAAALPKPGLALFVDTAIYEHRTADLLAVSAYYLGQRLSDAAVLDIGHRAAKKAADALPDDERVLKNLSFYLTTA